MHPLFESPIRIAFTRVVQQVPVPFILTALCAITCGLLFPLIIEKRILKKFRITRKCVLGLT